MKIAVLVEPLNGKGFRASGAAPFDVCVEGATREEALQKLETEVRERVKSGASIVELEIAAESNPWLAMAGMYKDDPLFDEWQTCVEEYREQVDKDEDRP